MVFTGTLRTRACCSCDHVEVLMRALAHETSAADPVPVTGEWVGLEEYLSRRVEARSSADRDGKLIG